MPYPQSYIPEGFHTITPFLMVNDAQEVVNFTKRAFDAEEVSILRNQNGQILHAQLRIGDSLFLLGDSMEEAPATPTMLYLYVADCDCFYERALAAGATSIREPADQPYGDRNAAVKDPRGNTWWIATHKEALTFTEIEERLRKAS